MKNSLKSIYRIILSLIIFSACFSNPIHCQEGGLYLQNYTIPNFKKPPVINSIANDELGIMYFMYDKGICSYDGNKWELINFNKKPQAIYYHQKVKNRLFIRCDNEIGVLIKKLSHNFTYKKIIDTKITSQDFHKIFEIENDIFFCDKNNIYIINALSLELINLVHLPEKINGYIFNKDTLFVCEDDNAKKIYKVIDGRLVENGSHPLQEDEYIIFSIAYSDQNILIGTSVNKMYLFDGVDFKDFELNSYVTDNYLNGGIDFSSTEVALSTKSGGVVIINKNSEELEHIINYQNGLPDDEISSMHVDIYGGLWISQRLGISRTDITIPVRNMTIYPGVIGEYTSFTIKNGTIYLGTSEGLFYLSKVKNINEINHLIKKEHKRTSVFETYSTIKEVEKTVRFTVYQDKNLQRKKTVQEVPVKIKVPVDSVVSTIKDEFKDNIVRKNYALTSIPFVYKRIKNINARCKKLLTIPHDKLLVATNAGLYEVDSINAKLIIPNTDILSIYHDKSSSKIFVGTTKVLYALGFQDENIVILHTIDTEFPINSISGYDSGIFISMINKLIQINEENENIFSLDTLKNFTSNIYIMNTMNGIFIANDEGVFQYDLETNSTSHLIKSDSNSNNISSKYISHQNEYLWLNKEDGWKLNGEMKISNAPYLNLFPFIEDMFIDSLLNLWVVVHNNVYKISNTDSQINSQNFRLYITQILDKFGNPLPIKKLRQKFKNNIVEIALSSPYYLNEKYTQFQYVFEGMNNEWSPWKNSAIIRFDYLPAKRLVFKARAKNILGNITETEPIEIIIIPPFWKRIWFYAFIGLVLLLLARAYAIYRMKKLERANIILQQKIDAATAEIVQKKDELEVAYKDIEHKNRNITDSINYAQRIQSGILPDLEKIKSVLPEFFVIFKPRDIVSGDFYWFHDTDDYFVLIAADCTGHGVPGAFMSMIGNTLLNQIVLSEKITEPHKICHLLDEQVIHVLKQSRSRERLDGMDVSICTYLKKKKELRFASAMNYLVCYKNNRIRQIQGDLYPIGGVYEGIEKKYTTHKIKNVKDTTFYIFSDGFPDQFGGHGGKRQKFMKRRFLSLLKGLYMADMELQEETLLGEIEYWKGDRKQNDDILIIGFRIPV